MFVDLLVGWFSWISPKLPDDHELRAEVFDIPTIEERSIVTACRLLGGERVSRLKALELIMCLAPRPPKPEPPQPVHRHRRAPTPPPREVVERFEV